MKRQKEGLGVGFKPLMMPTLSEILKMMSNNRMNYPCCTDGPLRKGLRNQVIEEMEKPKVQGPLKLRFFTDRVPGLKIFSEPKVEDAVRRTEAHA